MNLLRIDPEHTSRFCPCLLDTTKLMECLSCPFHEGGDCLFPIKEQEVDSA